MNKQIFKTNKRNVYITFVKHYTRNQRIFLTYDPSKHPVKPSVY